MNQIFEKSSPFLTKCVIGIAGAVFSFSDVKSMTEEIEKCEFYCTGEYLVRCEASVIVSETVTQPYQSLFKDVFEAVEKGTVDDVRYFLDKGVDVNTKNDNDDMLLHRAAGYSSDVEMVKFLVSKGADVKAKNNYDKIPLHFAAEYNPELEIAKYLFSLNSDIEAKQKNGGTPLLVAAWSNPNVDVLKFLVAQGANVNAKNDADGTVLHSAAQRNPNIEILKYLISQGADVNAKNNAGRMPLDVANSDEKKAILRAAMGKKESGN